LRLLSAYAKVIMRLPVGWGDKYGPTLPDQYIDITGLTSGRYRLIGTDAGDWFVESENANNVALVDIQLKGIRARIVAFGPSAKGPISEAATLPDRSPF